MVYRNIINWININIVKIRVRIRQDIKWNKYIGKRVLCADNTIRTILHHPTEPDFMVLRYPDNMSGMGEWFKYNCQTIERTISDGLWKLVD